MVTTRSRGTSFRSSSPKTAEEWANRRKRGTNDKVEAEKAKKFARVSLDSTLVPVNAVPLETIRNKHILGIRIARNTLDDVAPYCLGKVISITARGDESLDDDLYRVAYDDGAWEDVDTLTLFDALLLYGKISPGVVSEGHLNPVETLPDLLFDHSERIRSFLDGFSAMSDYSITTRVAQRRGTTKVFATVMGRSGRKGSLWTLQYNNGGVAHVTLPQAVEASNLYKKFKDEDPTPINTDHMDVYEEYARQHAVNKKSQW